MLFTLNNLYFYFKLGFQQLQLSHIIYIYDWAAGHNFSGENPQYHKGFDSTTKTKAKFQPEKSYLHVIFTKYTVTATG